MAKTRALFTLFYVSLAFDLWLIGRQWDWRMIPAVLIGWYIADLLSGLVHMYMDYRPCIPGSGLRDLYFWTGSRESVEFQARQAEVYRRISTFERIVYDFKKHHPMPDLLGRHGLFHLMKGPTFFTALPLSLALNAAFFLIPPPGWVIAGATATLVGVALTQYFHGTLHREDRAPAIVVMRRLGLLMTPGAHKHHHDTLTHDFSVINGWSNPVVNVCVRNLLRFGVLREEGLEPT